MISDSEKSGNEIEGHLGLGGYFDEIMKEIEKAVKESGFFLALGKSQTQWNPKSKGKSAIKEA